ncbi:MAG: LON peptidase substrate-binding domain-containing protein [Verrucomicrobiota bacterium JB023]|nr:LON peptidase substrate-binding domain-containing protein [Verrucomicrobiota bacterium JB023]
MSGLTIPESCGTILLPETVLFPHGALPLHIFEPRYREMLEDALESHCMICVGTLRGEEQDHPGDCTAPVGTIGLIRASREQEDGRSNLILHGIYRVNFLDWTQEKPYPYAHIVPATSDPLPSDEVHRKMSTLRDLVNDAIAGLPGDVCDQINAMLDKASDEPSVLADAVAQQFAQDPDLRYDLLEAPSVAERYEILFGYLPQIKATGME